jgi:hypothetical protein
MAFQILLCPKFLPKFIKAAILQGNGQKTPDICGNMVATRLRGSPVFLLSCGFFSWIVHPGAAHENIWRNYGKCAHAVNLCIYLDISQTVVTTP